MNMTSLRVFVMKISSTAQNLFRTVMFLNKIIFPSKVIWNVLKYDFFRALVVELLYNG